MNNPNKFKSSLRAGLLISVLLLIIPSLKAGESEFNSLHMSCISWLQVSVGGNGEAVLTPQMLLSNHHPDYSIFVVNIIDPPIGGNVVDCDLLEETVSVMVTNTVTNNSCWSMVYVEDKLAPVIECSDRELPCWESIDFDNPDFFLDTLYDNCTPVDEMDLWYSQTIHGLNCDPFFSIYLSRIWTATDNYGQSSTCEQTIYFQRGQIFEVEFPLDTLLDCPALDVSPDVTGKPTLSGNELGPFCGIDVQYTDIEIPLCGESFKIMRTWTLWDWCIMEMRSSTQLIEVKDTIAPTLTCPADITIYTGVQTCNATYIFPSIQVEDACSDNSEIDIRFRANGVLVFDPLTVLPLGENTIEVQAIDPCLNMSTCEYTVTVIDNVPPVLICENIVISLPGLSPITVTVETITSGFTFTDNCEVDENSIVIRRMENECENPSDLIYGPTIDVCCADIFNPVTVEVRVSDINGNSNSCMFDIIVQDKSQPVITFCPPDTIINCDDEMMDLSVYGIAIAEALCDDDIIREEVENTVDNCGEGQIIRTFIADNGSGYTDTCFQTIQVVNPYPFTIETLNWPDDINTTICNADLSPSGLGGEPEVEVGPNCSMVFGVTYRDSIPAESEDCERIYRIWTVADSCSNTEISHIQVLIFNLSEGPSILINVNDSDTIPCVNQAVQPTDLPVVIDACGDILNPVGPVVENDPEPIICEGERTYTWTYVDCSGNMFNWTFTYTIDYEDIDLPPNEFLVISCPEDSDSIPEPPVVLDSCGDVIIPDGPVDSGELVCDSGLSTDTRTYTWTYMDCAGNSHDWVFTYTLEYEDFEVPEDESEVVSCPDDTDTEPIPPLVEDVCGNLIIPTGPVVSDKPECEGDRTYTWTYTDCVGNSHDWVFTYTVEYGGFEVPEDGSETVSCPDDTDVLPLPPLVRDACENIILPTDPVESEKPECEGDRTYTWTYTDCVGNSHNWVFTYTVEYEDFEAPANVIDTVECPLAIETPIPPVVVDNCGNELEGVLVQTPEIPECEGEAEYIFEYEDCAGNIQFWSYTYVVQYQPFQTIPDFDFDIMCLSQIGMPQPPEVFDNCFIELEPIGDPEISDFPDCEGMVTFTWTFEDCAGNQDQFTGTFIITLSDPPSEVGGPVESTATVMCIDEAIEPTELPLVQDACGNVIPAPNPLITEDPDPLECAGTRSYTYTYFDCAENSFEWTFTYTVDPGTFSVPENDTLIFACNDTIPSPEPIQVFDNCGNELEGELILQDSLPSCEGEVVYTFQYEDCAENIQLWSFVYIIQVTQAPELPPNVVDTSDCPDPGFEPMPPSDIEDQCGNPVEPTGPEIESFTDTVNNLQIIIYSYEYEDCAGNTSIWTYTLVIDVEELDIECPENINLNNDPGLCEATIDIDLAIVSGGCGVDSVFNDFNFTEDASDTYPVGETEVTFTVIDITGAMASCTFIVNIEDNEDPEIQCPNDIVHANDQGECGAEVEVSIVSFSDNCEIDTIFNSFNLTLEADGFYPVDTTVVTYTVIDIYGNSAECSFLVIIFDNEDPVIECPSNMELPCTEFDPNLDLSDFGMPDTSDNCGIIFFSEEVEIDVDSCTSTGIISRIFEVFDQAGNSATCTQTIEFTGKSVLDSLDFIWPEEFILITDCSLFNPDSIPGGEPELDPDLETCNQVSIIMEDEFIVVDTACDLIIRTWTVTDLCNPVTGEWVFVQTIAVEDTIGPEFVVAPTDTIMVFADSISCDAFVEIIVEAIDDCAGEVAVTNNSNYANSNGADASGVYPVGLTSFEFEAVDNCGNVTILEVNVLVIDTIPPVIECFKFRYDIDDNFNVVAIDSDFVNFLSDNCTDSINIDLTFDLSDPTVDTLFLNFSSCDSIPGLFPITIYAIDEFGNIDSCETQIGFDDPGGFCMDSLVGNINGLVYHHDLQQMVEGVEVHLESPVFNNQISSDGFGLYEFLHVPQLAGLKLRPFKDDDPLNGVTTFDIYLMQRHILGINIIDDPYYLIAADVNNDGLINVLDVVELRRLILGTNDRFMRNTSWRFFDKSFIMPQGVNPTQFDLPESVEVVFSHDRFFQQDFVGVKIGDLNGNASTSNVSPGSQQRTGSLGIYVEDQMVKSGDLVTVEFFLDQKTAFNGIQFDLSWDRFALEIEDIQWFNKLEVNEESYHLSYDQMETSLRFSQSSPRLLETNENGYLFSLTFSVNHSGKLSEWIQFDEERIEAEIFQGLTVLNSLELRFSENLIGGIEGEKTFELFQNRPNPFAGTTLIPFVTDITGKADLLIFDITGKQITHLTREITAGYNQWELNVASLGLSKGVYYYQLKVDNHQAVRKMIVK